MDTDTILENVAEKWKTLNKNSQKAVMTALGGTHQANATAALIDNYNKVISLTKEAENSTGSAAKKILKKIYFAVFGSKNKCFENIITGTCYKSYF